MTNISAMLQAVKEQLNLTKPNDADQSLRASLLGQLYVADWKYLLSASGRMYTLSGGTVSGGGDITGLTGKATCDLDQPQAFVTVDEGHCLVPVELEVGVQNDNDAYEDEVEVLWTTDRTQSVPAGGTAIEGEGNLASGSSIQNCMDGGPTFPGRSAVSVTADITDPVHADILGYKLWEAKQLASETAGTPPQDLNYRRELQYARVIRGPSTLLLYVHGTVAPTWLGSMTFGCVPSSWFPTS
jgi:hypothetical protein